jgi:hypothetical protein
MTDPITSVTAVGSIDTTREWPAQADQGGHLSRVGRGQHRRLAERAPDSPAHTVDLSLDPLALRHLPADVYVRYYVHPGIGNYVVQVIDRRTEEVIREIPPGGLELVLRELSAQRGQHP